MYMEQLLPDLTIESKVTNVNGDNDMVRFTCTLDHPGADPFTFDFGMGRACITWKGNPEACKEAQRLVMRCRKGTSLETIAKQAGNRTGRFAPTPVPTPPDLDTVLYSLNSEYWMYEEYGMDKHAFANDFGIDLNDRDADDKLTMDLIVMRKNSEALRKFVNQCDVDMDTLAEVIGNL